MGVRSAGLRGITAWIAVAAMLVAAAALLLYLTRGTTLWFDEWQWALNRRGTDPGTFLEPHNGHLSLVPVVLYKLLFATAGLGDHAPYRLMVTIAHLGVVVLVFAYASRRVGSFPALCAAALILFLGAGWEDILWPFQVGYLLSLLAGLGALLLLDRRDRAGDLAASALLAVALGSSGLGIPIALGLAVDVVWGRRSWRAGWIVAAPLVLYAIWWVPYQDTDPVGRLVDVPGFVWDASSAAIAALLGLGGDSVPREEGTLLTVGRPLALAAAALGAWRLLRLRRVPPRVLALLTVVLSFWVLTELSRGPFSSAFEPRYIYVGALFVLLAAVELSIGVTLSRRACLLVGAVMAAVTISHLATLRDAGRYLRANADRTRVALAAVELARPVAKPGYVFTGVPGYPYLLVSAGSYFAMADDYGSPAGTVAELAAQPEAVRLRADADLVAMHEIAPRPAPGTTRGGTCSASRARALRLTVPSEGVRVTARGGPVEVAVRRFADGFQPVGRVEAGTPALVRIRADRSRAPWELRVVPRARVTACRLR